MPNLQGTRADASPQPIILARHGTLALVFAEDIKTNANVPNSSENDLEAWRAHLGAEVVRLENFFGNVLHVYDQLPGDLTNFDVGQVIYVDGTTYEVTENADGRYTFHSGQSGQYRGVSQSGLHVSGAGEQTLRPPDSPLIGTFTHNPVGAQRHGILGEVIARQWVDGEYTELNILVAVSVPDYERIKGSALARNDKLYVRLTDGNVTRNITLNHPGFSSSRLGVIGSGNNITEYASFVSDVQSRTNVFADFNQAERNIRAILGSSDEITARIYVGNRAVNANEIKAPNAKGLTQRHDAFERELETRLNEITKNHIDSDQVHALQNLLVDVSLGSHGVPQNWGAAAETDVGSQGSESDWTLQTARATSNAWTTKLITANNVSTEFYVAIRLAHAENQAQYRLKLTRADGSVSYHLVSQMWNMGNSSDVQYKYFNTGLTISSGDTTELEKAATISHLGSTEYNGILQGKVGNAIQRLTQAEYNALSDAEKTNGKIYSISDA